MNTRTTAMRFVDTIILLYAVSKDARERSKSKAALAALENDDLALSVQVLQEFYVQATRPDRKDRLTHEQAVLLIDSFLRFPVQEMTVKLVEAAWCRKSTSGSPTGTQPSLRPHALRAVAWSFPRI